jgi:hypothetical protein
MRGGIVHDARLCYLRLEHVYIVSIWMAGAVLGYVRPRSLSSFVSVGLLSERFLSFGVPVSFFRTLIAARSSVAPLCFQLIVIIGQS